MQKNQIQNAIFFIERIEKIKTIREKIATQEFSQGQENLAIQGETTNEYDLVILEQTEPLNKQNFQIIFNSKLSKKIFSSENNVSIIYYDKELDNSPQAIGILLLSKIKQKYKKRRYYNATIEETNTDLNDDISLPKKFKPGTFKDTNQMNEKIVPKDVDNSKLLQNNKDVTSIIIESQIKNPFDALMIDQLEKSATIIISNLTSSLNNDKPFKNETSSARDLLNELIAGVPKHKPENINMNRENGVIILMVETLNLDKMTTINEKIQKIFETSQFIKQYREILNFIKNVIVENLGTNEKNMTETFRNNVKNYFDTLIEMNSTIDDVHIQSYKDSILSYQDSKISVLNYRKCLLRNIDNKDALCKENELFYGKLEQFVISNFFLENFKFNNLYVFIKESVQTLGLDNLSEDTYKNIKEDVINVLKQASVSAIIQFNEIPKLVNYLETTTLKPNECKINDICFFYACLNILNVLLHQDWNIIINKELILQSKLTGIDNVDLIVRNERYRQNFNMILLFVARHFVSKKRIQEAWCKSICQDLVVTHLSKAFEDKKECHDCSRKLIFLHLFEIFTFEQDDAENKLIDEKYDHNMINETVSRIINFKKFTDLNVSLKNPLFRQNFFKNISCILNILNI
ncbi:hypothetical protein COBT_001938 [Conglomerata obtusa]